MLTVKWIQLQQFVVVVVIAMKNGFGKSGFEVRLAVVVAFWNTQTVGSYEMIIFESMPCSLV